MKRGRGQDADRGSSKLQCSLGWKWVATELLIHLHLWDCRAHPAQLSASLCQWSHTFCCDDSKIAYEYIHIRLKSVNEIKVENTTCKKAVHIHPCTGTLGDVNGPCYNPFGGKLLSSPKLCPTALSTTTAHHTACPLCYAGSSTHQPFAQHTPTPYCKETHASPSHLGFVQVQCIVPAHQNSTREVEGCATSQGEEREPSNFMVPQNNWGVKGPLEVTQSSESESLPWLSHSIEASRESSQQPSGSVIRNSILTVFQWQF